MLNKDLELDERTSAQASIKVFLDGLKADRFTDHDKVSFRFCIEPYLDRFNS